MRLSQREAENVVCNVHTLLGDLKSCSIRRDLHWGKRLHARTVQSHNDSNMYVVTALIQMYAKCGTVADARHAFDSVQSPDVVSWNALLMGYADNRQGHEALNVYSRMKASQCTPTPVTYVAALKACTLLETGCLERGREIHLEIGCRMNQYVQCTLIDMYTKGGSTLEARRVFDSIQNPNVVSWNALLLGYVANGEADAALKLYSSMKGLHGRVPDYLTYVAALKACTSLAVISDESTKRGYLERGRVIHSEIGCQLNDCVQCTLIDMYAKCGSMVEARQVFDSIGNPNVIAWTALLFGYADTGEGHVALDMFSRMTAERLCTDPVIYVAALKACTSLALNGDKDGCLQRGRQLHSEIGCHSSHQVQSALIDMYAKCGCMTDARRVFDGIQKADVVSWSSLLLGYVENGDGLAALDLFSKMSARGCAPDSVTYIAALKACASLAVNGDRCQKADSLRRGRNIHSKIGCHLNGYVKNTLIDMYSKCGSMLDARLVFDSVKNPSLVSWNALLQGYTENGDGMETLALFSKMKTSACLPDSFTYVAVLKACTTLAAVRGRAEYLKLGRRIHSEDVGCHLNGFVRNTLIDMYAKCGSMIYARRVFDSIDKPDLVAWNALLLGYAENGDGLTTLDLFSKMKAQGCTPDTVTYIAALKASGLTGVLTFGRKLHSSMSEFTTHVVTCLVDFYAKCGSMLEAHEVFALNSRVRDVSTWNALLAGHARFGDTASVFNLFEAMQDGGFRPDSITFLSLLMCCSHAGLVTKAREYFEAMLVHHGVVPTVMHYTCMVDALGRANQLNEAIAVMRTMPCKPNKVTWVALLGACRKWKNVEIGKWAFQSLVDMDQKHATAYVVLSHRYGKGTWEEQERVLDTRVKLGTSKQPSQVAN